MELSLAVQKLNLALVRELLRTKHDPNALRNGVDEGVNQPDRPLKMVMFRLSDALLEEEHHDVLCEIAKELIAHGADPGPAMQIAEWRYGPYSDGDPEDVWEAWHVVARAHARGNGGDDAALRV